MKIRFRVGPVRFYQNLNKIGKMTKKQAEMFAKNNEKIQNNVLNYQIPDYSIKNSLLLIVGLVICVCLMVPTVGISLIAYFFIYQKITNNAQNHVIKAYQEIKEERIDKAISIIDNSKFIDTNFVLNDLAGIAYFQKGNYDKAGAFFEYSLSLQTKINVQTYYLLAECYRMQENTIKYPVMIDYYKKYLSENLDNSEVQYLLGFYGLYYGNVNEALQSLQSIDKNNAYYNKALLAQADYFIDVNKPDLAITTLKLANLQVRQYDEDMKEIFYMLGVVCNQIGDIANSKKYFNKLYVQDSNYKDIANWI